MIESADFLTGKTAKIFEELSEYAYLSGFTFVGGSALAYYLKHRLSEDLDFFSSEYALPVDTDNFLNRMGKNHTLVTANASQSYLDVFVDDVKITLFANGWEALKNKRVKLMGNIFAADLDLLCAMKVHVLSLRAKYRDYYDLYLLNSERFSIEEMLSFAIRFIPGMTKKIFAMQLTYIADIEDENIAHLSPKRLVTLKEIQMHFEREIKKII